MAKREFYYRWEWQLQASPSQLWPLVADTNRFNRDTGLPTVSDQSLPGETELANGRRHLRLEMFGIPLEWVEEPFEWIQPHKFGVVRDYAPGPIPLLQPMAQVRVLAELTPRPDGGTHLVYEVWVRPRSILGYLAIPVRIGFLSARRFDAVFREYDRLLASGHSPIDAPTKDVRLAPGGRQRLLALARELTAQGASPVLVNQLVSLIEQADDLSLQKIRPYALADYWGVPRRDVLELCLLATRLGLLNFQWELLCPLCRVPKQRADSLSAIKPQIHCEVCHIDYTANFDRSVELTFRPNPAIRLMEEEMEFCVAGPQVTPHIAVQQLLPAGERRTVQPQLETGRYRLRSLALPGGQSLQVTEDAEAETLLSATVEGWSQDEVAIAPVPLLHLQNATETEQLFILERLSWTDQAVTAAEVTALQRFRDLFANEALRPGDQISVGSLTILFTDLCDSTRLYQEIGDAPAFGLVMNHFDVLREVIAAEDGALVKTIGDAVMAVFRRPVSALRAIFAAQQRLAHAPPGRQPLLLKAAIHHGPSIAVTLNERLDYFGTTINIGSRLEKLSEGGDIIISEAVYADPEVREFLAEQAEQVSIESFAGVLRGLAHDFSLWRIKMMDVQHESI